MGLKVRQPGPNGEAVAVTMGTGSPWDRTKADIMPAHAGGYVTDLAVGGSFTVGASATGGTATQQFFFGCLVFRSFFSSTSPCARAVG